MFRIHWAWILTYDPDLHTYYKGTYVQTNTKFGSHIYSFFFSQNITFQIIMVALEFDRWSIAIVSHTKYRYEQMVSNAGCDWVGGIIQSYLLWALSWESAKLAKKKR